MRASCGACQDGLHTACGGYRQEKPVSRDLRMYPMPPSARDEAELSLSDIPVEHCVSMRLAIRRAYADGYDAGYGDGHRAARQDAYDERQAKDAAERRTT